MHKNFYELNDYLFDLVSKGNPASVIRLDNTAGYIIDCALKQEPISEQFFNPTTILEGGIYPNTREFALGVAYSNTLDCMKRADCVGFVDVSNAIRNGSVLKEMFKDKVMFFSDGHMVFDPAAILGYTKLYIDFLPHQDIRVPWTRALTGKKVLAISTHVESIKHQWQKRKDVWGKHFYDVANFELVDVIRAPYHPYTDDRQYPNCATWQDMVEKLKEDIASYDFDVLLSGATASSPMFVDHAKALGKIGIQTGGSIQILFGVKGGRWAKVAGYSDWHKMFNEHWIYPLDVDKPQRSYDGLESNFAYWG